MSSGAGGAFAGVDFLNDFLELGEDHAELVEVCVDLQGQLVGGVVGLGDCGADLGHGSVRIGSELFEIGADSVGSLRGLADVGHGLADIILELLVAEDFLNTLHHLPDLFNLGLEGHDGFIDMIDQLLTADRVHEIRKLRRED